MTTKHALTRSNGVDPGDDITVKIGSRDRRQPRLGRGSRDRLLAAGSVAGTLVLWEIAARAGAIDPDFFPPPSGIARSFWSVAADGALLENLLITMRRLAIGFTMGVIPALALGLTMGFVRPLRIAVTPLVSAVYPIPKSAIMPLMLLIFGFGEPSKWVLVALGAFFPVLINAAGGVLQISKVYQDVAANSGATRRQYFRTIAFPGALPSVMTGLQLALGQALILLTLAEIVGAQSGIGYMIWNSWQVFNVELMYVGLATIAIVGGILAALLRIAERRLIAWNPHTR
ncbi:ABC transporter permease [Actinomadura chibensis]|uniref:ABC transporter permease n=2 Tax=Actinomadura chibensis TaxID=392828 RepID=A0A5D0NZH2_9ACTN|nr:ABC transporter permease [Actinomadura chibensis]